MMKAKYFIIRAHAATALKFRLRNYVKKKMSRGVPAARC